MTDEIFDEVVEETLEEYIDRSVCLMYPVDYPTHRTPPPIDDLHSTVLYLGSKDDLPELGELISILSVLPKTVFQYVDIRGLEFFGPEQNIPVLRIEDTVYLWQQFHNVSMLLAAQGIFSPSIYEYAPHVSLSYDPDFDPQNYLTHRVLLRPMELWYGTEHHQIGWV